MKGQIRLSIMIQRCILVCMECTENCKYPPVKTVFTYPLYFFKEDVYGQVMHFSPLFLDEGVQIKFQSPSDHQLESGVSLPPDQVTTKTSVSDLTKALIHFIASRLETKRNFHSAACCVIYIRVAETAFRKTKSSLPQQLHPVENSWTSIDIFRPKSP